MIENSYTIVAIINDEIVGYLAGSINKKVSYEEIQCGEINNMFIKNQYRGKVIGKILINNFKEYCISIGINNLIVTASAENINAIGFYRRNSFKDFNLTLTVELSKDEYVD